MCAWCGATEKMDKSGKHVLNIVLSPSYTCNRVDRMDQVRLVNPSRRHEKRVSMSIFTWALDIACNNALSIMKSLYPDKEWHMRAFKREILMALVRPLQTMRASKKTNTIPQK